MSVLAVVFAASFCCWLLLPLLRRAWQWFTRGRACVQRRLPPGSMGWPYVGETLKLYSQNPNAFFSSRQRLYGEIFKTHILGCPCVMIASAEAARFVLVTRAHLFKPTYPRSKEAMIGPQALFFHEGPYHARVRQLVLSNFLPEGIRGMVRDIEALALSTLNSWQGRTINTFMEAKKFAFNVAILKIFGNQEGLDYEDLHRAYACLEEGYNSLPLNVPGLKFSKAQKARRYLASVIQRMIEQRRRDGGARADFLSALLGCAELADHQIVDNVIGLIFASRDTTASVLTWLVKFLQANPALLESVAAEHERIKASKEEEGAACSESTTLTWGDTKSMRLTSRVIQETLRMATVLSFTFREAVEDVEYKGYVIPKGWKVLPLFRSIHHSPEFFPEPQKFDPSRFEVPPKPNTFLPFGNGVHSCPGSELAKLEMLVFIHHLTTAFRWEVDESKIGIQYSPFLVPEAGLPIKVFRK